MAGLIFNIKKLVGCRRASDILRGKEMSVLPCIGDAYIVIESDSISGYGKMSDPEWPSLFRKFNPSQTFDASNRFVLPTWCDSHTHLVYAASREEEFIDKIRGMSYAEIASNGGGILNSARRLNDLSEDVLFNMAWQRLQEIARTGTGSVEIKSGYGLTVEGELKMLRVIRRLKEKSALTIRSTFLGAHAYPQAFQQDHGAYIDSIIHTMLPVIAQENLADFIDVFCEKGFFSPEEMELICSQAARYGLKLKLHVNQLNSIGGIETGIRLHALSLDHLEVMNEKEIDMLAGAQAIGTLLPTAAFFLRLPMPPARKLIDAGAAIALASDYNPGSSPSGNMNLVISMACIQMKMLPEEAINAATINGAFAMDCGETTGSITPGKKANLIVTKPIPSLAYLPYSFGAPSIEKVMINGAFI